VLLPTPRSAATAPDPATARRRRADAAPHSAATVDFPCAGSQDFRWRGPRGNVLNSGGGAFRAGFPPRRSQLVQGVGRGEHVELRRGAAGVRCQCSIAFERGSPRDAGQDAEGGSCLKIFEKKLKRS